MFIGHCHPEVSAAVDANWLWHDFFANNSSGIALAEDIVAALPAASRYASFLPAPKPICTPCAWHAPTASAN